MGVVVGVGVFEGNGGEGDVDGRFELLRVGARLGRVLGDGLGVLVEEVVHLVLVEVAGRRVGRLGEGPVFLESALLGLGEDRGDGGGGVGRVAVFAAGGDEDETRERRVEVVGRELRGYMSDMESISVGDAAAVAARAAGLEWAATSNQA